VAIPVSGIREQIVQQRGVIERYMGIEGRGNVGWRWISEDKWHLTLLFLGNLLEAQVNHYCQTLREALSMQSASTIEFDRVAIFPSQRKPRYITLQLEQHV